MLDSISSPKDLKKLDSKKLADLAEEIREFLIDKVSKTGGHLASNLGVVELTLALHSNFDTPKDKIIWDVGHQTYVHKIITGRKDKFDSLRKFKGMSGFPKVHEDPRDCFNTGHSSTSISAALGMARARDIKGEDYSVIAVIGDGSFTGGMAFEALNDAGNNKTNLIVILNDNGMSISSTTGGLSHYLNRLRNEPLYNKMIEDVDQLLVKIPYIGQNTVNLFDKARGSVKHLVVPGMLFEEFGFKYLGPIDGHNINDLNKALASAKAIKGPVLVHVCTQKGKGYTHAEDNPMKFHGIAPFEVYSGAVSKSNVPSYSEIFGTEMVKMAKRDKELVLITAAMKQGTGLDEFSKTFPERIFDVGIAEQHAVTLASGMARCGLKPVFSVYSSFLQRAYDQIVHDVCTQNLHVVFAIDRAGIVGEDGETHHGVFDISFLSHIPNMTVMTPGDYNEFALMLDYAVNRHNGPIAVRYPRGTGKTGLVENVDINYGKGIIVQEGTDATIISFGHMLETSLGVAKILEEKGVSTEVINARFVKPLDEDLIIKSVYIKKMAVTIEDNAIMGGAGSHVVNIINRHRIDTPIKTFGFPDRFIEHGSPKEIYKKHGMDVASIANEIIKSLGHLPELKQQKRNSITSNEEDTTNVLSKIIC
ncbi:MAG TPA: 1-deoxy-D-xylulose-5-phosphate synthase [Clostridia bacterium]